MMGAWIDLKTRKLTDLPEELYQNLSKLDRTEDFRTITKEDTRAASQKPVHLGQ